MKKALHLLVCVSAAMTSAAVCAQPNPATQSFGKQWVQPVLTHIRNNSLHTNVSEYRAGQAVKVLVAVKKVYASLPGCDALSEGAVPVPSLEGISADMLTAAMNNPNGPAQSPFNCLPVTE